MNILHITDELSKKLQYIIIGFFLAEYFESKKFKHTILSTYQQRTYFKIK